MPLTDIKIRQAKTTGKAIKLPDAAGLYIEVKPNGSKLWRYRYRIAGRENLYAIATIHRSYWPMRARLAMTPAT